MAVHFRAGLVDSQGALVASVPKASFCFTASGSPKHDTFTTSAAFTAKTGNEM
jgi:hypothetical protein